MHENIRSTETGPALLMPRGVVPGSTALSIIKYEVIVQPTASYHYCNSNCSDLWNQWKKKKLPIKFETNKIKFAMSGHWFFNHKRLSQKSFRNIVLQGSSRNILGFIWEDLWIYAKLCITILLLYKVVILKDFHCTHLLQFDITNHAAIQELLYY